MSDKMVEHTSGYMPTRKPNIYIYIYMPKRMPEKMSDRMSEYMSNKMPHGRSSRMPNGMLEYMPDDMPAGGDHSKKSN